MHSFSVVYGDTSVRFSALLVCVWCVGFSNLLRSEALVDEVRQGLRCIAMALTERAAKVHLHTLTHTDAH